MNRLLILVAVGLVGTGCIVTGDTCDVRDIRVDWHGNFLRADGNLEPCGFASSRVDPRVVDVDVFVNGEYYDSRSCSAGSLDVYDALPGDYDVIVEGRDVSSRVVSRDWFTVHAADSCGDILARAQPAEGLVQLSYSFSDGVGAPTATCVEGSDLLFSITDTLIGSGSDAAAYPPGFAIPCSSGAIPLAYGSYRIDWLEERSGGTLESSACGVARDFDVGAASTTAVGPISFTIGGPTCH